MNRFIALGAVGIGGVIAFQLSQVPRRRLGAAISRRMLRNMEHMMASLPENSPPKLVMSVLPQLRDQNDQIIAMLQEQNALLREHLQRPH
jgi:hypothetical protein